MLFNLAPRFKKSFSKVILQAIGILATAGVAFFHCQNVEKTETPDRRAALEIGLEWNAQLLRLDRFSEGYRPPVSARMWAYVGIAAWESALPAMNDAYSLSEKWPEFDAPRWKSREPFVLPAALEAAYSESAKRFFPHALMTVQQECAALSRKMKVEKMTHFSPEAVAASQKFGREIAEAVFKWSATDTVGHQAFLYNYEKNRPFSIEKGRFQPSDLHPMPALLPNWGLVRTFIAPVGSIDFRPPVAFSENHSSAFFAEAVEVHNLTKLISDEHRWIAEFWSDDLSGLTFSPASRWISIANQTIETGRADFASALETWLKIGLSLNDVTVQLWAEKYRFDLERPETYIRRNIDPNWESLHGTPPFPGYPSGHAGCGSSCAQVLSGLFGQSFRMTDRSHEGRREFLGQPRTFDSFEEMAAENAFSRIPLGVHFRMDCDEGLRVGREVGEKVMDFRVRKSDPLVQLR